MAMAWKSKGLPNESIKPSTAGSCIKDGLFQ